MVSCLFSGGKSLRVHGDAWVCFWKRARFSATHWRFWLDELVSRFKNVSAQDLLANALVVIASTITARTTFSVDRFLVLRRTFRIFPQLTRRLSHPPVFFSGTKNLHLCLVANRVWLWFLQKAPSSSRDTPREKIYIFGWNRPVTNCFLVSRWCSGNWKADLWTSSS